MPIASPDDPFAILAASPTPFVVLDQGWRYTFVNTAGAALTEQTPDDLVGRDIFEVHPQARHGEFHQLLERVRATGEPGIAEIRSARTGRWHHAHAFPWRDGVVVFFTDITANHALSEQLAQASARLEAILDALPQHVVAVDAGLHVLTMSRSAAAEHERLWGRPIRIGDAIPDAMRGSAPPEQWEAAVAMWASAVAGEEITVRQFFGVGDGMRLFESRLRPLREERAGALGAVLIAADVTEAERAERALRGIRRDLERAQELTRTGSFRWELQSNRLEWSRGHFVIFGLDPATHVPTTQHYFSCVHPDDVAALSAAAEAAIAHDAEFDIWYRIRHADGTWRHCHSVGEIERDASGTAIVFSGTIHDQTEAVRREQAVRDSRRQLERGERQAKMGSWTWEPATGETSWSEGCFAVFGLDRASFTPSYETFRALVHPDDLPVLERGLQATIELGAPYELTLRIRRSDGTWRVTQTTGDGDYGADGRLVRLYGTIRDCTEEAEASRVLRASERRFRTLAESSPLGIFLSGPNGRAVYANPRLREIMGLVAPDGDALADDLEARIHPEDRAGRADAIAESVATGRTRQLEYRIRQPSGRERIVRTQRSAVLADDGSVAGFVGIVEDITDARLAEEERRRLDTQIQHTQKLESLGVLAGGIAHDFNNLLVGMLGNASLALLDLPPESPVRGAVSDIERAAQRAAELTRQLLAYSGRGRFVVEPVDLSRLVEDMGTLLRTVISRRAVLHFDLMRGLPAVQADATQIRQVVMNLITNASDAVGERSGTIVLRTGVQHVDALYAETTYFGDATPEGDYVFVEVSDNGEGMARETLERIFEPFFTTKFTGRGLGLAATLGIVRGHRGSIKVYSEPGRGTTFKLLFPIVAAVAIEGERSGEHPVWRGEGTVLVVDDEDSVRAVARSLLARKGISVLEASDGEEALRVLTEAKEPVNAVLLDLTMPRMGGDEAFRRMRAHNVEVPVILMSGYSEQEVTNQFRGKGLAGFVQKPFRAQDLYEAVSRVLSAGGASPP